VLTNVIVNDGDTLVLGGMVTDSTTHNTDNYPYLSKVPLVRYFFTGRSRSVRQSSLLIFVTTDIIDETGARTVGTEL